MDMILSLVNVARPLAEERSNGKLCHIRLSSCSLSFSMYRSLTAHLSHHSQIEYCTSFVDKATDIGVRYALNASEWCRIRNHLILSKSRLTTPISKSTDEASSALDATAEQDFLRQLRHLLESKDNNLSLVLFVTHKKSVLQACDRVLVLSDGRVTETGSYDVLDSKKGDQLRKLMMGESSILK